MPGKAKVAAKLNKKDMKAKAKEESEDSDDSDDEELQQQLAKQKKAPAVQQHASDDSDDSGDSEELKPTKAAAGQKRAPQQQTKQVPASKKAKVEEELSESEDSDEAPVKNGKAPSDDEDFEGDEEGDEEEKGEGENQEFEGEDDEEEEEKPKQKHGAQKKEKNDNQESASSELFVGNLSWNVDDNMLHDTFSQYGTVTRAKVLVKDGKSRGIGFVDFETRAEAEAAVEALNESELDGRNIRVKFSEESHPKNDRRETNPDAEGSQTIFIGNVGFNTTKDTLWEFFEQYGSINDLRLATDRDGNPRGFAHCEFATPEDAKKSLAAHGQKVDGRAIRVDLSAPKSNSRGEGGRDFGGRDFGGRGGRGRGGFGDRRGGFGDRRGGRGGFGDRRGGFGDRRGGRGGFGGRGGRGGFQKGPSARGNMAGYSGERVKF